MPTFKTRRPLLPGSVDRPRPLGLARRAAVAVLAAPAGHGKSYLAAQVADLTGGPAAWFVADEMDRDRASVVAQLLDALVAAWPDLGPPDAVDENAAVSLLGATLETLAGPGCVVVDDAHLLPADVLAVIAKTAVAALPPDCRLVICTREGVPDVLLSAAAAGRAALLSPTDLVFDEEECGRVCGSNSVGARVYERTGGWPLAVALSMRHPESLDGLRPVGGHPVNALADMALAELVPAARELLIVLARLPRFPARLLTRLGGDHAGLTSFATANPALLGRHDDWWAPREWLRDALRDVPADRAMVDDVARALRAIDEAELSAQLLLAEGRFEEAVPQIEGLAAAGLRAVRPAWVRSLIAGVPPPARSFTLELLAAGAARKLDIVDPEATDSACEAVLLDLVDRAAEENPGASLQARALLATHYYMTADARALDVCRAALAEALSLPESQLRNHWPPDVAPAAAEMLRHYGSVLVFMPGRESVEQGRRLVKAALDVLDAAGLPTTSQRAWSTFHETMAFVSRAADVVGPVRIAAHRLTDLGHGDTVVRLGELATIEYFAGDGMAARRTIEVARDCVHRLGNGTLLPILASLELGLDVLDDGYAPEHAIRFDDIAMRLAANSTIASYLAQITAEFGFVLVRRQRPDLARSYLERAEAALAGGNRDHVATLRCRRLRGLILLAEGSVREGTAVLDELRRDAAGEGRIALVDIVDGDLAEPVDHVRAESAPIVVHVLGPELRVTVDRVAVPAPKGYAAKLLALLVASNGLMTIDATIEGLWPGADPDVGRNRLHGVLLRLRRSLGLRPDGPISCSEGLVRFESSSQFEVDSWEFERLATGVDERMEAVSRYAGDVLETQFAYDDTVAVYRNALRRTFLRLAAGLLDDPDPGVADGDLAALARRAIAIAPEDEEVGRASAHALVRTGHRAEAREVVASTASALDELGLDGEEFRRRAVVHLGSGS